MLLGFRPCTPPKGLVPLESRAGFSGSFWGTETTSLPVTRHCGIRRPGPLHHPASPPRFPRVKPGKLLYLLTIEG